MMCAALRRVTLTCAGNNINTTINVSCANVKKLELESPRQKCERFRRYRDGEWLLMDAYRTQPRRIPRSRRSCRDESRMTHHKVRRARAHGRWHLLCSGHFFGCSDVRMLIQQAPDQCRRGLRRGRASPSRHKGHTSHSSKPPPGAIANSPGHRRRPSEQQAPAPSAPPSDGCEVALVSCGQLIMARARCRGRACARWSGQAECR